MSPAAKSGATSAQPSVDDKLRVVQSLVQVFRIERTVHLITTTVSLIMLLTSAGILIAREHGDTDKLIATLVPIFGASGLMTYSANRLLHMWDQAVSLILGK